MTIAGLRFPPEVILSAVRWYSSTGRPTGTSKRFLPSEVSRLTTSPWTRGCQRFTSLLIDAARPCRHLAGDRWIADRIWVIEADANTPGGVWLDHEVAKAQAGARMPQMQVGAGVPTEDETRDIQQRRSA